MCGKFQFLDVCGQSKSSGREQSSWARVIFGREGVECVGRVKYVLVILGWRVMCEVKVNSWERMKFMKGRNVRERDSSVWGE